MPRRPVYPTDLVPLKEYDARRSEFLARRTAASARRQVYLKPWALFLFESFDTVLVQVLEALHARRFSAARDVQAELDHHNRLLSTEDALCATLFLMPDTDPALRERRLPDLLGVEKCVTLRAGPRVLARAERNGGFVPESADTPAPSPVHFLKFPLDDTARAFFLSWSEQGGEASPRLVIDHPRCLAGEPLGADLLVDLRNERTE
jgi:hypothetical protein